MNRKHDTALRISIWTLVAACVAICVYFALHKQFAEALMSVLCAGQNVCNIILLNDTEQ